MLEILLSGIYNNNEQIDSLYKYVKRNSKIIGLDLIIIFTSLYFLNKKINDQQIKIDNQQEEIEELKENTSKGE